MVRSARGNAGRELIGAIESISVIQKGCMKVEECFTPCGIGLRLRERHKTK